MSKTWLVLILLAAVPLAAQPVLTEEDLPDIGYEAEFNEDTSETIVVDVKTTGGPQEWDFSELGPGVPIMFDVLDPADTPIPDSFPEAEYVYHFTGLLQDTVNGEWWQYIKTTSSEVLMEGDHMYMDMFDGVELSHDYDPDIVHTTNPLEMGSTWNNHYRVIDTISPAPVVAFDRETWSWSEVDAWGAVITPSDTFEEVLRYVTYDTTIELVTFLVPLPPDTFEVISYTWVTAGNGPVALVESLDGETDPEFSQAESMRVLVEHNLTGAVEENPESASWIRVAGNSIEFNLEYSGWVVIDIYDVSGRNLETLMSASVGIGEHCCLLPELSSGVYFVSVKTPYEVLSTRFVTVR